MPNPQYVNAQESTDSLVGICHGLAAMSGWWKNVDKTNPFLFSTKLMLIVSEVSEAMEADRKDLNDDHLPQFKGRDVELADALIRICDLAGAYGIDLGAAVAAKLEYNQQRTDHKPENRAKEGGKKY